jgi:hypothetical protein
MVRDGWRGADPGCAAIVVGHSVTADRRGTERFDERVIFIHSGMLVAAYQGRGSAFEFVELKATAVYLDGRETLVAPTP